MRRVVPIIRWAAGFRWFPSSSLGTGEVAQVSTRHSGEGRNPGAPSVSRPRLPYKAFCHEEHEGHEDHEEIIERNV